MKLYLVVQDELGYYDEPDKYTINAICTSPEGVLALNISDYSQKEIKIITVDEKQLDTNINIVLNPMFGFGSNEVEVKSYHDFLTQHDLGTMKPNYTNTKKKNVK